MQSKIPCDSQLILIGTNLLAGHACAAEYDLGVLIRQKHYLAQFLVDDLLLRFSEVAAGFYHWPSLGLYHQRSRRDRAGCKLRFATKVANSHQVIVSLKPQQSSSERFGDELTLRSVEPELARGSGTSFSERFRTCWGRVSRAGRPLLDVRGK